MTAFYYAVIYYGTLLLFGALGLVLHAFSLLAIWLPWSGRERFFQRLIHRHFAVFVAWLKFTRVCRVDYRGFEAAIRGPLVLAANHPGLMDAIYLIARVPEAVCIFKGSIRRNPVLGAARSAGYLANDGGLGLVRDASAKVAEGATLVVFPEGTRTPTNGTLGRFKPGFASIARQARAPIQLVRITSDAKLLAKGSTWWKLPRLPAHVTVEAGPRLEVEQVRSTAELVAAAEAWFRATTVETCGAPATRVEFATAAHPLTAS